MNTAYIFRSYFFAIVLLIMSIVPAIELLQGKDLVNTEGAIDFIIRNQKKVEWTARILWISFVLAAGYVMIIPAIRDIPNIINKDYRIIEGRATRYSHTTSTRKPRGTTIKDKDGNEVDVRIYFDEYIEVGDRFKIRYLPHIRIGEVLKSGKDY